MRSLYQYQLLNPQEIRVVRFKRHESTRRLSFEFRLGTIDELRKTYTAISYCWGIPDRAAELFCSYDRCLRVTRIVEEIAHWLVDRQCEEYFWIDFLCINQGDLREKGEQVAMMRTIFSSSAKVEAWLGYDIEDGEAAVRVARDIKEAAFDKQCLDDDAGNDVSQTWPRHMRAGFPQSDVNGLRGLLRHPWFTRVWVAQEIVAAPEVESPRGGANLVLFFNHCTLPWSTLVIAIGLALEGVVEIFDQRDGGAMVAAQYICIMSTLRDRYEQRNPVHFGEALLECLTFQASDARDMIYAVKGICRDVRTGSVLPDYTASVPDVYCQAAYTLIVENQLFNVLVAAGVGLGQAEAELPSWTPDWRLGVSLIGGYDIHKLQYTASGSHRPDVRGHWESKTLTFKGIQIDFCGDSYPFPQPKSAPPETIFAIIGSSALQWVKGIEDFLDKSTRYSRFTKDMKEVVLVRTMTVNSSPPTTDSSKLIDSLRLWLNVNDTWDESRSSQLRDYMAFDELNRFNLFTHGLSGLAVLNLFGSEKQGFLGLGPKGARKGDMLCVLLGLHVPCLLRPKETKEGNTITWEFVGVCYVDGLMYGEGLEMGPIQGFTLV
ncbi:MAG: hypothetical protein Q9218_005752 [Villophora microphyllina]